jgi:hypothetical protein
MYKKPPQSKTPNKTPSAVDDKQKIKETAERALKDGKLFQKR